MGVRYTEYRLPRDLAGFEPVTVCFQDRPKMPQVWKGGSSFYTVLDSDLPLSLLKQETTDIFRENLNCCGMSIRIYEHSNNISFLRCSLVSEFHSQLW